MTAPRILVVGAGSIGSRHARNLVALGAQVTLLDPDPSRAGAVPGAGFRAGDLDEDTDLDVDGVVIASPTSLHARHLRSALAGPGAVLVEKPLATAAAELAPDLDLQRVMVGYNLRLLPAVASFVSLVHKGTVGRPLAARCWFGYWLPAWRPAVDYRRTYSARRALGGGILLDAIHELDLLVWLAGPGEFSVAGAVVDRLGPLEIDCEDTVKALLRHEHGLVAEVSLDYLSRRYRRGIEVVGTEATAVIDWERAEVRIAGDGATRLERADLELDAAYVEEARRFLRFAAGAVPPPVAGPEGLRSLVLADAIRAAAQ